MIPNGLCPQAGVSWRHDQIFPALATCEHGGEHVWIGAAAAEMTAMAALTSIKRWDRGFGFDEGAQLITKPGVQKPHCTGIVIDEGGLHGMQLVVCRQDLRWW